MKKICKTLTTAMFAFLFLFGLIKPNTTLAAGPARINLGVAGGFAILAKTGISTTGQTSVVGDLGVSPAAASYITGFALTLPASSAFSTSALVNGKIYAPGYADPTPAKLTTAVGDMETAYTSGAGLTNPTATELGAGNIGGLTIAPGLYKWSSGVTVPTDVTLSGSSNDVWVFVVTQNLNVSSAAKIVLSGGAQASNIFWVVAGQTTVGTTAVFNGNILDKTAIVLNTGAKLNGRALAQTAVTLDSNVVTTPTALASTPDTIQTNNSNNSTGSSPSNPNQTHGTNTNQPASSDFAAVDNLKTQISELLVRAQTLQLQIQAGQQGSPNVASDFGQQVKSIAINLGNGSKGNNVSDLQKFLISQGKGPAAEALSRVGATAFFGILTRSALAEFQSSVGINPALGNFGPITRAYLATHY